jgi:hypothetical protein
MSTYTQLQALQAVGITIRRANHCEETITEYGEQLQWVIDLGGQRQARHIYRTKAEAIADALDMIEPLRKLYGLPQED